MIYWQIIFEKYLPINLISLLYNFYFFFRRRNEKIHSVSFINLWWSLVAFSNYLVWLRKCCSIYQHILWKFPIRGHYSRSDRPRTVVQLRLWWWCCLDWLDWAEFALCNSLAWPRSRHYVWSRFKGSSGEYCLFYLENFLLDPEIIRKKDPYWSHFSSFNQSETTLFKV